jgi:hypothetical protein
LNKHPLLESLRKITLKKKGLPKICPCNTPYLKAIYKSSIPIFTLPATVKNLWAKGKLEVPH